MNSCHEEGVRDWDRAGIEATDPARCAGSVANTPRDVSSSENGHCYGVIEIERTYLAVFTGGLENGEILMAVVVWGSCVGRSSIQLPHTTTATEHLTSTTQVDVGTHHPYYGQICS
eukprot:gene21729-biopygen7548